MDAKQARRSTRSALRKQDQEYKRAWQEKVEAKKKARARGRKNYLEHLKVVRKRIREATNAGKSSVSADIAGSFTQTNEVLDRYYYGAQEQIKKKLESEGYKVEISQRVSVDEPFGSDPMFDRTMYWLRAIVDVSW